MNSSHQWHLCQKSITPAVFFEFYFAGSRLVTDASFKSLILYSSAWIYKRASPCYNAFCHRLFHQRICPESVVLHYFFFSPHKEFFPYSHGNLASCGGYSSCPRGLLCRLEAMACHSVSHRWDRSVAQLFSFQILITESVSFAIRIPPRELASFLQPDFVPETLRKRHIWHLFLSSRHPPTTCLSQSRPRAIWILRLHRAFLHLRTGCVN